MTNQFESHQSNHPRTDPGLSVSPVSNTIGQKFMLPQVETLVQLLGRTKLCDPKKKVHEIVLVQLSVSRVVTSCSYTCTLQVCVELGEIGKGLEAVKKVMRGCTPEERDEIKPIAVKREKFIILFVLGNDLSMMPRPDHTLLILYFGRKKGYCIDS